MYLYVNKKIDIILYLWLILILFEGIWDDIKENKERFIERYLKILFILTDLTDGYVYKILIVEGNFLDKNNNLIVLINIDGLSFYLLFKI